MDSHFKVTIVTRLVQGGPTQGTVQGGSNLGHASTRMFQCKAKGGGFLCYVAILESHQTH